jgi:hypothetical protein
MIALKIALLTVLGTGALVLFETDLGPEIVLALLGALV